MPCEARQIERLRANTFDMKVFFLLDIGGTDERQGDGQGEEGVRENNEGKGPGLYSSSIDP